MSSLGEEVKDWLVAIAVAVVLAFVIRQFIVELYVVDGPSMRPTLQSRERLVVNKFIYRMREPERGEIIVFRYPRDPSRDFIKRVIAVPGDTIEIKDGKVFLNQQLLNEDYILEKTLTNYPLSTVPAGHIFVMGDNRNNSEDISSRARRWSCSGRSLRRSPCLEDCSCIRRQTWIFRRKETASYTRARTASCSPARIFRKQRRESTIFSIRKLTPRCRGRASRATLSREPLRRSSGAAERP